MGTPCNLIAKIEGEYKAITVNYDGYPDYMLETLKNYRYPVSVSSLFDHGDASSLDITLDRSEFYHRDRGEDLIDVGARTYPSIIDAHKQEHGSYTYLYDADDNVWNELTL